MHFRRGKKLAMIILSQLQSRWDVLNHRFQKTGVVISKHRSVEVHLLIQQTVLLPPFLDAHFFGADPELKSQKLKSCPPLSFCKGTQVNLPSQNNFEDGDDFLPNPGKWQKRNLDALRSCVARF